MFRPATDELTRNAKMYETLNNIYHRFKIDTHDTMLYLDTEGGEMIPFFNVKVRKTIFYNNPNVKDVLRSPLFNNELLQKKLTEIVEDVDHDTGKFEVMYVNCSSRYACNYLRYLKLDGIVLSTRNFEEFPGISRVGKFENIHVHRKIDDYYHIASKNLFFGMTPVANRYEIVKGSCDVSVGVFKTGDNEIKIYGIRFDDISDLDVQVIVYAIDDDTKFDRIKMKLTSEVFTRINHVCPFGIEAQDNANKSQHIPKRICQTLNHNLTRSLHYKTVVNLQMLNPEYEYVFFNSRQRRDFIKKHFDESVLETYDGLVSGAFKADVFRYCWLYLNGGVYVDCKMIARAPLRDILVDNEDVFLCEDRIPNAYQNCIIGSVAKQPQLFQCISECVKRYDQKFLKRVSFGSLYHTGPYLFHHCMKSHVARACFRGPFNDLTYTKTGIHMKGTNKLLFNVWFKDYYKNYGSIHKRSIWSQEWAEGKIYYSKKYEIKDCPQYSIRIYPGQNINEEDGIRFFYKEGSHIYNNTHDKIICQIIDEYQNIEQKIIVGKNPDHP